MILAESTYFQSAHNFVRVSKSPLHFRRNVYLLLLAVVYFRRGMYGRRSYQRNVVVMRSTLVVFFHRSNQSTHLQYDLHLPFILINLMKQQIQHFRGFFFYIELLFSKLPLTSCNFRVQRDNAIIRCAPLPDSSLIYL